MRRRFSHQPNVPGRGIIAGYSPRFWGLVVLIGVAAGVGAAVLTVLLNAVQYAAWGYRSGSYLRAVMSATAVRHLIVLLAAGVIAGVGGLLIKRVRGSGAGEISEALWLGGGRLSFWRSQARGVLSIVIVPLGGALFAVEAAAALDEEVERMRRGETRRFLVGVGHGTCTCEGAAFEYIVNLEFELRHRGVRDKAELMWITNEYELGDFGMGGMQLRAGGYVTPSSIYNASLFAERGIDWITRAHVNKVEPDRVLYETLDGAQGEHEFDFAMLLPPFSGVGLKAYDREDAEITERLFLPNEFMRVDADYTPRSYEEWKAADWPRTYQSPDYANVFAAGIAFAPPHAISVPRKSPNGTVITPAPPRTGMPSAMIGKAVARSIVDMIAGAKEPTRTASMAEMGAACVASAGANPFTGTAASMTVFPIVPDYELYPEHGRDPDRTFGEIGLAGHWIKILLHHMFLYKARLRPGWRFIPE